MPLVLVGVLVSIVLQADVAAGIAHNSKQYSKNLLHDTSSSLRGTSFEDDEEDEKDPHGRGLSTVDRCAGSSKICKSGSGNECLLAAKPTMICVAKSGKPCFGRAPSCAQIRSLDDKLGADGGDLCDSADGAYWLTPDANSAFPIAITASMAAHATKDGVGYDKAKADPKTNKIWHAFCQTADGVERIETFDSGTDYGTDTGKIWAGARAKANCTEHPAKLPTAGFVKPTTQCFAKGYPGKRCVGPAPTCDQIRKVDAKLGVENGDLCDHAAGYFLAPPPGSDFPISIAASIAHHETKNGREYDKDKADPKTNKHWHPFCMTEDGVERIHTYNSDYFGTNTTDIWIGAAAKAECPDYPKPLPTTSFTVPTTECVAKSGELCIKGKAPTCAQIRAVDKQWSVDNGDLCDNAAGYFLAPPPGSDFPISVAASIAHHQTSNGREFFADKADPKTNVHWHPFCMTVNGVERIPTPAGATEPAEIWKNSRVAAKCPDSKLPLPTTGFTAPAPVAPAHAKSNRFELIDMKAAPAMGTVKSDSIVLGVDGGDLADKGFWIYPEEGANLPISIATSTSHQTRNSDKYNNTHWHAFCVTKLGLERIPTNHAPGTSTCKVWEGAMKQACCEDFPGGIPGQEGGTPRYGLDGAMSKETCVKSDPTVCIAQTGFECIGPAPTCDQIKAVDDQWGPDNGDLCPAGFWMTPEEGSDFPFAVSASDAHYAGTMPKLPESNTHWHPFCMTKNGPARISTVNGPTVGGGNEKIWEGTLKNGGCPQWKGKSAIPKTGLSMPGKVKGVVVVGEEPFVFVEPQASAGGLAVLIVTGSLIVIWALFVVWAKRALVKSVMNDMGNKKTASVVPGVNADTSAKNVVQNIESNWKGLIQKMTAAQLINVAIEIGDAGSDLYFWLEISAVGEAAPVEHQPQLDMIASIVIAVVGLSLLLQIVRWLHTKKVYDHMWTGRTPETRRKANVKLAVIGAGLCLLENIPQIVATVMYLNVRTKIPGIKAWTPGAQLNITLSGMSAAWKLLCPILTFTSLL
jgi:hypothetical protein